MSDYFAFANADIAIVIYIYIFFFTPPIEIKKSQRTQVAMTPREFATPE